VGAGPPRGPFGDGGGNVGRNVPFVPVTARRRGRTVEPGPGVDRGHGDRGITMHLFSRTITLRGKPREIRAWTQDVCTIVNERTPFDVSLWQVLFGAPLGTVAYSCLVESRAALLAGEAGLVEDDDYLDLIDKGQDMIVVPAEDRLVQMVHHAAGELQRADVGAVADITAAQVEVDRIADAMDWSIGMADLAASITGFPVHLGTVEHGPFGELQWTGTVPDITEADRTAELLAKDPDYVERLGRSGGLFVPGSGRQLLALRVA